MARGDQPLLADDRPASEASNDRTAEEEDALLTGQHRAPQRRGWPFWREIGAFAWAILATITVIALAVAFHNTQSSETTSAKPKGKRNLIFMVSDGMGPTSMTMTRSFRQRRDGRPIDDALLLDRHVIGQSRTRSSSSLVTDSAAGATAFSCGRKSYNGAISVTPGDHAPCGTVLEAAKRAGYMTGLVVTTRLTDATPACFAAHAELRSAEDIIARQMVGEHPLGRVVDLMLGGGRCHFVPNDTSGSCRADGRDVVAYAKEQGFSYIDDRQSFDALNGGSSAKLPLLGLFAPTDIPYEIDRRTQNDVYPALDEMARTALRALSIATKDSEQGFFLMVEGSRIDHAGHANDPAAQVHEVLAFDDAFSAVLDFLEKDGTDGVAVTTSDHETGGLATARQLHDSYPTYAWFPEVLANASHSAEYVAAELQQYLTQGAHAKDDVRERVVELLQTQLGIGDASDEELNRLVDTSVEFSHVYALTDMVSRRAQTGWSTHGHSGVDVNIYASDPRKARALAGNHENTEVGDFLRDYLDLDLGPITKDLQKKGDDFKMLDDEGHEISWLGPSADGRGPGLDHYHHDFKKRSECGCGL